MTEETVQPLRANKSPLPAQARQYVLRLIRKGLAGRARASPLRQPGAGQMGISRATLRPASFGLGQKGVVRVQHGVGNFVAPDSPQQLCSGLERMESVLQLAARRGVDTICTDQALARIVALDVEPSLARDLGTKPQQVALFLEETLSTAKGAPIDFSRNYYMPERFQPQVVRR